VHRVALAADGLLVARPVLGSPALGIVPKATLRQRRKRRLDAAGRKPLTVTPDYYALCEALIVSGRLTERECLNDAKVVGELTEIANEWSGRWMDKG